MLLVKPQVKCHVHKTDHWSIRRYESSWELCVMIIIPPLSVPKAFYGLQIFGLSFLIHLWILLSAFNRSDFQISSSLTWSPWKHLWPNYGSIQYDIFSDLLSHESRTDVVCRKKDARPTDVARCLRNIQLRQNVHKNQTLLLLLLLLYITAFIQGICYYIRGLEL